MRGYILLFSILSYNVVITSVLSPTFDVQTVTVPKENISEIIVENLTPNTEYKVRLYIL